jgi:hypothetical protein
MNDRQLLALWGDRRPQGFGGEINHRPNRRQHAPSRREDEMHDAVGAAPLRQHPHKSPRGKRVATLRGRQQNNSSSLACSRYQNVEAVRRKAGLDRHGAGFPALRRQKPGAATLLLLMEDGKRGQFRRRRRFTLVHQELRTCDQDTSANPDPFHLQVGVGVETLPDPNCHIDPFVDQVDSPIADDTLKPQERMGSQEARHAGRNRTLKSKRTTQSNQSTRFGLHSKRGLLRGFSLDNSRMRMFEDLLADLRQTEPSRRSVKQPYAEPLLEQRNATADPRFWHSQRAGGCGEPAIENDGRKKLEIIEITHHDLSNVPSAMGRQPVHFNHRPVKTIFGGSIPALMASARAVRPRRASSEL